MSKTPYRMTQHDDGQIYISDQEGTPVLHAIIREQNYTVIQVGARATVEIDKEYGPLVFMPVRVHMDFEACEWVVERGDGGNNWREVTRFPGQIPEDFVT